MRKKKVYEPEPVPPFKPQKLVRFVDGVDIGNLVADYDPNKNILRVNREVYQTLPVLQQREVWHATHSIATTK